MYANVVFLKTSFGKARIKRAREIERQRVKDRERQRVKEIEKEGEISISFQFENRSQQSIVMFINMSVLFV